MLGIIMLLDFSARLTPQVTTIICHQMKKKILLKKYKKYGRLDQNLYVKKTIHR